MGDVMQRTTLQTQSKPSQAKRPARRFHGYHPSHVRDSSKCFDLLVFLVILFFVSAWKRMLVLCALRG